jgi:hypothetical protein
MVAAMTRYQCASPYHDGSRLILDQKHAFGRREEFRRVDGMERPAVRTLDVWCESCVRIESARWNGVSPDQEPLL